MSAQLRRNLAALVALVAIIGGSVPATASNGGMRSQHEAANSPVAFDVLVLRPVGFVSLALGAGLFVIATPFTLITRPHEISKPWNDFVVRPAKFLWVDPIGGH